MTETTIVRENLMTEKGYTPYCGCNCPHGMPRTEWDKTKEQFVCICGWVSMFPIEFIKRYTEKWTRNN